MIENDTLPKPVTITAKNITKAFKKIIKELDKPVKYKYYPEPITKEFCIAYWGNKIGNQYWKIYQAHINLKKKTCEKKKKEIK